MLIGNPEVNRTVFSGTNIKKFLINFYFRNLTTQAIRWGVEIVWDDTRKSNIAPFIKDWVIRTFFCRFTWSGLPQQLGQQLCMKNSRFKSCYRNLSTCHPDTQCVTHSTSGAKEVAQPYLFLWDLFWELHKRNKH